MKQVGSICEPHIQQPVHVRLLERESGERDRGDLLRRGEMLRLGAGLGLRLGLRFGEYARSRP